MTKMSDVPKNKWHAPGCKVNGLHTSTCGTNGKPDTTTKYYVEKELMSGEESFCCP